MPTYTKDDIIGISIVGGLGVIGLISNGLAILVLIKGGRMSMSFQQLCFSHSVANIIALAFFLFYCTPMIILQSNFSSTTFIGKLIGGFMVAIWDVSVYSHLISSINRLIVISWPLKSRNFLNQRNTTIMISLVWFLGVLHFLPYFKADVCYVVFYSKSYLWSFSPNYCGFILGKVLDFGTGVSVFALIIIFDTITIWRIKSIMSKKRKLRRRELKFFAQSCLQFSVFVVKLTNFYFISGFFTGDPEKYHWPLFFTTTFAWECTHCVDGLILIVFQYAECVKSKSSTITSLGQSITKDMKSHTHHNQAVSTKRVFECR